MVPAGGAYSSDRSQTGRLSQLGYLTNCEGLLGLDHYLQNYLTLDPFGRAGRGCYELVQAALDGRGLAGGYYFY